MEFLRQKRQERVVENQVYQLFAVSVCSGQVVEAKPLECDGFKDEYTKFNAVYLTAGTLFLVFALCHGVSPHVCASLRRFWYVGWILEDSMGA